ncbi:glycosyltransferase [Polynucleobacter paneuropaeus]|nr:glycosyltransferase [Polynucleobacter paneuropaeus]
MASYNGVKYIQSQILSILHQLNAGDELIISDNGSLDGTLNLIHEIKDDRIKLFHLKEMGVALNFENALIRARGKYIFLSDQDDIWMPGRVVSMLEELKVANLVMSNAIVTNAELDPSSHTLFQLIQPSKSIPLNILQNTFTGCCIAFDRDILRAALPFPLGLPMHDWWIGLVAISIGEISLLDRPSLLHRRHESNTSTLSLPSKNSIFDRILMRIFISTRLFLRITLIRFQLFFCI